MASLFELNAAFEELCENNFNADCIDEETGEIDLEKANALLDNIDLQIEHKINNLGKYIKNLQCDIFELKQQEAIFKLRRKAKERKEEWAVNYLKAFMQRQERTKIEFPEFEIYLRNNPPRLITEEDKLPDDCFTFETIKKVNNALIRKKIKEGEVVTGATLVSEQSLKIK